MNKIPKLITPRELDRLLRYPTGRSLRLAKKGKLPFVELPDGDIRFVESQVLSILGLNRHEPKTMSEELSQ